MSGTPMCLALLALLGAGCGGARFQHVIERPLPALEDLACTGYAAWSGGPVRDVFLAVDGSGIESNAFVHPTIAGLMRAHPVAYLTYDKPGIRAPFGAPGSVRRDDETFQRYTLGHGVACVKHALRWARELGPSVRIHLRAHSEGTLVVLYAYEELLASDAELAASIATIVLSGLAVDAFRDILERQLATVPDGDRVRAALAACDWSVLRQRLGVSCAYVADASARPSGRAILERLAARGITTPLHVFHGTDDWNTPVGPVRTLEAWNAAQGHLPMTFHYYKGGHRGSAAARAEMTRFLATLVSP